ncbi:unnamed protein product, partial [Symbiodinium necroappetens]
MHRFEVKGPGVCTQSFVDSISPATWPTNFGDPKNLVLAADYVYFVPDAGSTTLFRADVATMTQVQELSVGASFSSGFTDRDGAYVYLVPDSSGYAFKRVATSTFDATETAELEHTSFMGGFVAGEFVYVMPGTFAHGVIYRVDIEGFSTVSRLYLTSVDSSLRDFSGGFHSGEWGYLVPLQDNANAPSSKVVRFKLATFSTQDVEILQLSTSGGFIAGFQDGRYGYLVGKTSQELVRFRLDIFGDDEALSLSGELSGNEISGALKVGESLLQYASIYHCRSLLQVLTVEVGDYAYVLAKDGKVAAASAVFLGCRTFLGAFPEPWSTGHDDTSCTKVHVELATFSAVDVFDVNGGSDAPRPAVMAGGRIIIRRTGTSAGVATFDRTGGDSDFGLRSTVFASTVLLHQHRQHTLRAACQQEVSGYTMEEPAEFDYSSFTSAFTDDKYVYFFRDTLGLFRSELLLDSAGLLPSQKMTLPEGVQNQGYFGGFVDGNYGYLLPSTNHAIVLRFRLETFTFVDSLNLADSFPFPHALVNWWGGFIYEDQGYLLPNEKGVLVRFNLANFNTNTRYFIDFSELDAELKSFRAAVLHGTDAYVVPHEVPATSMGVCKVVRLNLDVLESSWPSSLTIWDISGWADAGDGNTYCGGWGQGFSDGFTDGTFVYMLPGSSGQHLARFAFDDFGSAAESSPEALVWVAVATSSYDGLAGFAGTSSAYLVQKFSSKISKLDLQSATVTDTVDVNQAAPGVYGFYAATSSHSDVLLFTDTDYKKLFRVCQDHGPPDYCSGVSVKSIAYSNNDYTGLNSGFSDDTYIYLVPHQRSVLFRYDRQNTVSYVDLPTSQAYSGGFAHGNYAYLVPGSGNKLLLRINLLEWHPSFVDSSDLSLVSSNLQSFYGGFHDDTYGYLVPGEYGQVARFQLGDSFGDIQVLDITAIQNELRKFRNGFSDGTWGYLVPYQTSSNSASGKVVRFDLATFSTVEVLDVASSNSNAVAFNDGFHDGTYGYLVPGQNGIIARFSLGDFTSENVQYLDASAAGTSYVAGFQRGHSGYVASESGNVFKFNLGQFSAVATQDLQTTLYDMVMVQGQFYALSSSDFRQFIRYCEEPPFVQVSRAPCQEGQELQNYSDVLPMSVSSIGGVFSDGLYLYTLPMSFLEVHRFDLATFQIYQKLDLSSLGLQTYTYSAGLTDGAFGYLIPGSGGSQVVRFDLASFAGSAAEVQDLAQVNSSLTGFSGGFLVGSSLYLVPQESGHFVRIDDWSSVTSLSLTSTDADLVNLRPGFVELDASFAFLASYQDASYQNTGKIVKISLSSFSVDSVLDLKNVSSDYVAFSATFSENFGGYSGFALCSMTPKVIRYALGTMALLEEKDFTEHSFTGFAHGAHDGTYGYLASDSSAKLVQFNWQENLFAVIDASNTGAYGFNSFALTAPDVYLGSSSDYRSFYRKCPQELSVTTTATVTRSTSETSTSVTATGTSATETSTFSPSTSVTATGTSATETSTFFETSTSTGTRQDPTTTTSTTATATHTARAATVTSSTTTASANAVETNGSQCSQGNLSYTHYLFDAEADIPRLLGAGPSGLFTDAVSMNIFSEDDSGLPRRGIAPQTNFTGVDLAQGGLFSGFRAGFFAADLAVLVPRDSSWVAGFNVSNAENTISLNLLNHSAELTNFTGGFAAKAWAFLVPAYFGRIPRLRADDLTFSGSVDLTETSPDLHVFSSGFFVDGYGFLVPHSSRDGSPLGKVVRFHVDTLEVELLDLASLNENLAGFHSGIERDGFGYLVPGVFGWAARFELADFSLLGDVRGGGPGTSSVRMLNLTYVGDFMGAHLDTFGSTVYFITLQGEFVAVDLPDFSLSDVSDGQLETEYSEYYPSLLYYPSAIAGWGRHSFLWSLGPTMLSLECDNGVAETGTPKTIVTFVMYGYDDASWRDYAWALSMIDGRSPVSMHASPGPFGSWVGENFLIERESGDVVLNVTWQEDMVSQEFQGIAGETLYLTVTPGNSSGGDGRWWDIIDDHGIAYSSWHQLYPTKQPFMAVGATLRAGGGHSERAKFEEFYVEPTATLSLSVSPRGDTNGTNIAWVLYDVNMDAIMRSGDEIWEKFPRNAIFSPRRLLAFCAKGLAAGQAPPRLGLTEQLPDEMDLPRPVVLADRNCHLVLYKSQLFEVMESLFLNVVASFVGSAHCQPREPQQLHSRRSKLGDIHDNSLSNRDIHDNSLSNRDIHDHDLDHRDIYDNRLINRDIYDNGLSNRIPTAANGDGQVLVAKVTNTTSTVSTAMGLLWQEADCDDIKHHDFFFHVDVLHVVVHNLLIHDIVVHDVVVNNSVFHYIIIHDAFDHKYYNFHNFVAKNDFALPSTVREDSPEGAVVAAALESVLLATKSSEGSVTSSTPSGNVTVVKLSGSAANSSTPDQNRMVLQINNGNAGAAGTGNDGSLSTVAVSVPLAVVEDLAQGQNVLLSVMTIAEEVSLTLPNANTERETVELTSKVMELSLVLEAGGAVTVANVSDLTEPIAFQLTAGEAVPGDQCAFFDPVSQTWSTKGMGNMDAETFAALGLGSTMNGTWCLTTHTSMFALVQIIPFESMWDPEAGALNANGYIVAGLVPSNLCLHPAPAFRFRRPCCSGPLAGHFAPTGGTALTAAGSLTGKERLRRAWRAGAWAKLVLAGTVGTPNSSPPLNLPSRFYVVLGGEGCGPLPGLNCCVPRLPIGAGSKGLHLCCWFAMASFFSLEDLTPYHVTRQLMVYEHPSHDGDGITECLAAVVLKRDLGFLLALPRGVLDDAEVAQGLVAPVDALLGPTHPSEVPSMLQSPSGLVAGDGRPVQFTLADLSVDALSRLSPYDPEEPPELMVAFDAGSPDLVPEPAALLSAAQAWVADPDMAASERVTFYSADEAPVGAQASEPKKPRPVLHLSRPKLQAPPPRAATGGAEPGPGQQHEKPKRTTMAGLAAQLDTLVATLPAISNKLAEVDQKQQELATMVTSGAAAPLKQPLSTASALGAGSKPAGPLALTIGPPPGSRHPPPGPPGKAAEETADLEEAIEEADPGDHLARAMLAQSQALTSLVQQLAAAGGDGSLESGVVGSLGVRGSAQRARLQEDLAQGRGLFYQQVCANMARRMMPSQQPGASQTELVSQGISLTRYWERFGGWSGSRDLGLLAFQVGLIFDALLNDRVQLAKDHLALLAVCLEQAAMDGGRMEVAYQMTFLEDPPSSMFMARAGPSARSRAFAPLASQRWVSVILTHLRELDTIQARRGEQTRPKGQAAQDTASESADSPPRRRPPKKKPP